MQVATTILEFAAFALIVAGAVAIVWGIAAFSIPLAFIVGGGEAALIGFGMLAISRRVLR